MDIALPEPSVKGYDACPCYWNKNVFQLIKLFWKICYFKSKPQEVPNSYFLLGLVTSTFILSELLTSSLFETAEVAFSRLPLTLILQLGLLYSALRWFGLRQRFPASGTALLGTGMLLNLINYLLYCWMDLFEVNSGYWEGLFLLLVASFLWELGIISHILRHSFSMPLLLSIGLTVLYLMLYLQIQSAIFPMTSS